MTDILIVGEAWGEREEEEGRPFVGASGFILNQMLAQAGINRADCYLTNVFNFRPKPSNDVKNLCGPKTGGIPNMPELLKGKYVRAEYASELERLYAEIAHEQPNIIIALGATAAWALLHSSGIKSVRGFMATTAPPVTARIGRMVKVLPTYHPAAVARQWSLRPIVITDLAKAQRHSTTPQYERPSRQIWIKPAIEDILQYEEYINASELIAADIETKQDQITCIGFSPSPETAIVIPFFTESGASYWSRDDEIAVWNIVRRWLTRPTVFQNGMYDMTFLWQRYGIPSTGCAEDTMLLHHAFQPEMEKGLAFLASVYTDEASWKFMIKGARKHD